MKKNDVVKVTIGDVGIAGEGIGKVDGYTLFIKDAILGDEVEAKIVKAKKNYGYARLVSILKASKDRQESVCQVARQCGGCQIQEMKYEKQLEFKRNKVVNNLVRLGGFDAVEVQEKVKSVLGMEYPFEYRNKAQFPIGEDKDGNIITGFYAGRTHAIISNTECAIGAPINKKILEIVLNFMKEFRIKPYNEETQKGLVRHVLIRYGQTTKEIMVCLVLNGKSLKNSEILAQRLMDIQGMTSITYSVNEKNTNVIMGEDVHLLAGTPYITDYIGAVKYQISPLSFYQVNPLQTNVLYGKALEYARLTGDEVVWDLYCGIGTISLFLAQKAKKVYGVEIVPQAIEDARENARINEIDNVEFFVGKAEEVLPREYEKNQVKAEVIVVDPPRKGCDQTLLETMVTMEPERIVYVSCDSATLARDLKFLCDQGYEMVEVTPVDMFPHTVHVESVCLLHRANT